MCAVVCIILFPLCMHVVTFKMSEVILYTITTTVILDEINDKARNIDKGGGTYR